MDSAIEAYSRDAQIATIHCSRYEYNIALHNHRPGKDEDLAKDSPLAHLFTLM
jgi:hypothetical protein